MSDLVRVRVDDREFNVGRAHAEANKLDVLDESPRFSDGSLRPVTRRGGRPRKPKVSVAEAAEKKAAESADRDTNPPPKEI
jgi:hypothetical protein